MLSERGTGGRTAELERESLEEHALYLTLTVACEFLQEHSRLIRRQAVALSRGLILMNLGQRVPDHELFRFILVLVNILRGLETAAERWVLITHPTIGPTIIRALVPHDDVKKGFLSLISNEYGTLPQVTRTALRLLDEFALQLDGGDDRLWPGLIRDDLAYGVKHSLSQSIRDYEAAGTEFTSLSYLIRWIAESVPRDPSTAARVKSAGVAAVFCHAAQWHHVPKHTLTQDEPPFLQSPDEIRIGQNTVILWVFLLYTGAQLNSPPILIQCNDPPSESPTAEYRAVITFIDDFLLRRAEQQLRLDSLQLGFQNVFTYVEQALALHRTEAVESGLTLACERLIKWLAEIGCQEKFYTECEQYRRAIQQDGPGQESPTREF